MSGSEPSLPYFCVFFSFFSFLFWVDEWVNGCLSNVLFTAAVGLQMSGFEPSLLSFCALFSICFPFFYFGWVRVVYCCCCSYSSSFDSIPKIYLFWLSKLPNVWRTFFFGRFSKPENFQKHPGYLRPTLNMLKTGNT